MALEKRISRTRFTVDMDGGGKVVWVREAAIVDVLDDGKVVSTYEQAADLVPNDLAAQAISDALTSAGAPMMGVAETSARAAAAAADHAAARPVPTP